MHDDATSRVCFIFATLSQKTRKIYNSQLLRQKSIYQRKMKYLTLRRLRGKGDPTNGGENMLSGTADETEWKMNFRLNREDFMELVDSIRHIVPIQILPIRANCIRRKR